MGCASREDKLSVVDESDTCSFCSCIRFFSDTGA